MVLLTSILLGLALAETAWKNDAIKRTFFLNSAIVREDISITATPTSLDPNGDDKYLLVIRPGKHLTSWDSMYIKNGGSSADKQALEMTEIEQGSDEHVEHCIGPKQEMNRCFWIHGFRLAGINLTSSKNIQFMIGLAYRNLLQTVPAQASQNDPLAVLLEDSPYLLSPYQTSRQKTSLAIMQNFKILAKSCPTPNSLEKAASAPGLPAGMIQYSCGVYENVGAWDVGEESLKLHYSPIDMALATIERHDKDVTVLPWFNVLAVTEKWMIRHDGFTGVDDSFHRSTFLKAVMQKTPRVQYIGAFPFLVPSSAYEIDLRDENGRLTGRVDRSESPNNKGFDQLVVSQRYPLFGGWRTSIKLSYKLPLNEHLFQSNEDPLIKQLQIPLFSPFFDLPVLQSTLRFNLPEDAEIKDWACERLESERVHEERETYKTYFSSTGEKSLILHMENLSKDHSGAVSVLFAYPWWAVFRKPLVILLTILFILAGFRLGSKIDLSIAPSKRNGKEELIDLAKQRHEIVRNLEDLLVNPKNSAKQSIQLQKVLSDCNQLVKEKLQKHVNSSTKHAELKFHSASLCKLYTEHQTAIEKLFDSVSKEDQKAISRFEKSAINLDSLIVSVEAKLFK